MAQPPAKAPPRPPAPPCAPGDEFELHFIGELEPLGLSLFGLFRVNLAERLGTMISLPLVSRIFG